MTVLDRCLTAAALVILLIIAYAVGKDQAEGAARVKAANLEANLRFQAQHDMIEMLKSELRTNRTETEACWSSYHIEAARYDELKREMR